MNLPLFIAFRYLFARKTHNVINVMSSVSAAGIAVGTAALIIILSVYNGFNRIIEDNLGDFDPDVAICRSDGGFFGAGELTPVFSDSAAIACMGHRLEFEGFMTYGTGQSAVLITGSESDPTLVRGDLMLAAVGAGLAARLGVNPGFTDSVTLYSPDRTGRISLADPESSLRRIKVFPEKLFSVNADIDANSIIIPLNAAQELFGIDGICTSLDIRLCDGSADAVSSFIASTSVPEGFVLLDRRGQHRELYRMMALEKAAVYAILLLVVLIVALNIFSSLSLLRIEKEGDVGTLRAMGAQETDIRRIFLFEGWLISVAGTLAGVVAGVLLTLLQQHSGLVKLPGNMLVDAYPVVLSARDVLISAAGSGAIGMAVSLISCCFCVERPADKGRKTRLKVSSPATFSR